MVFKTQHQRNGDRDAKLNPPCVIVEHLYLGLRCVFSVGQKPMGGVGAGFPHNTDESPNEPESELRFKFPFDLYWKRLAK